MTTNNKLAKTCKSVFLAISPPAANLFYIKCNLLPKKLICLKKCDNFAVFMVTWKLAVFGCKYNLLFRVNSTLLSEKPYTFKDRRSQGPRVPLKRFVRFLNYRWNAFSWKASLWSTIHHPLHWRWIEVQCTVQSCTVSSIPRDVKVWDPKRWPPRPWRGQCEATSLGGGWFPTKCWKTRDHGHHICGH